MAAEHTNRRFNPKREIKTKSVVRGNKEVLASADFRNLEFLNEFVTDGGQIVPRTKTKLQAKVHRHLARQIKTARVMALLPHSGEAMLPKGGLGFKHKLLVKHAWQFRRFAC